MLDNFATVAEAVAALRKEPFQVIAPILPNGLPAQLHLSLSDATGDSAIFEYLGGKLVIHHGKQYQVMTNSPSFDQQLALNNSVLLSQTDPVAPQPLGRKELEIRRLDQCGRRRLQLGPAACGPDAHGHPG